MTKLQKLVEKREGLKLQILAINKQIQKYEVEQKRKQQAELLNRIKASGLLDKSPEELEQLINSIKQKESE